MLSLWVRYSIAAAFMAFLMYQVRKPSRIFGRVVASTMNASHSRMTDWGLTYVPIEKQFTILDVGSGGGRTIRKHAAAASDGAVYGVDYAAGSVAASRAENRDAIQEGRVEIEQASVSQHSPTPSSIWFPLSKRFTTGPTPQMICGKSCAC
jgi:cyclopropane fatty-acyl-phospholipid synthase-like methyltransferase